MLDLHTHILPGFDDGAADWNAAVAMARAAVDDGIQAVVATPHVIEPAQRLTPEEIRRNVQILRGLLKECGVPLQVYPGAEVRLALDLPDRLRSGRIMTLADNGRYVLVELPFGQLPLYTGEVLYQLQLAGVTPIIAHPERNETIQKDPARLAEMVRCGCLAQVTGGSLLGSFGRQAEKAARRFVRQGLVHVVASDGHAPEGRMVCLSNARRAIMRLVGENEATVMSVSRPNLIANSGFVGSSSLSAPVGRVPSC